MGPNGFGEREDLAEKKLNRFISSLPTTPKKNPEKPTNTTSMLVLIIDHLLSNCCGSLSRWFLFFSFANKITFQQWQSIPCGFTRDIYDF